VRSDFRLVAPRDQELSVRSEFRIRDCDPGQSGHPRRLTGGAPLLARSLAAVAFPGKGSKKYGDELRQFTKIKKTLFSFGNTHRQLAK